MHQAVALALPVRSPRRLPFVPDQPLPLAALRLSLGIARGLLVPFSYFGLRDEVDYANIPWLNRRFEPEALAAAVQTERRMERLWEAWGTHPGKRTLVFCCSVAHAEFVTTWLKVHGVRAEAVHSGPESFDRQRALDQLRSGELDALCSVDLFNEGLDVPNIDRVVMLRPTKPRPVGSRVGRRPSRRRRCRPTSRVGHVPTRVVTGPPPS